MCITIGVCDTCLQPVYWLTDHQKWHHYSTRNVDCYVVTSDLLVGVAPENNTHQQPLAATRPPITANT